MDDSSFDVDLRRLADLADQIDDLDAKKKLLGESFEKLSYQLAMYMEGTGCRSKKLDNVNFIKSQRVFSKVEDKEALMNWVKKNAAWDLIMAVNTSKLTGFCNECLENKQEVPPGVSPNFIKHYVQIRRGQ